MDASTKMDRTRRVASDKRILWGHKFTWTPEHPTMDDIRPLLFSYDKLATEALDRFDAISPPPAASASKCPLSQRDLYALLEEHADSDPVLGELWNEVTTVPDWVDWEQIRRGQELIYQYSGQIVLGLMFRSLVGGMAAWRVVETLARTGGFGVQVTRRRLLETFQHFIEVAEDLDAVKPGGKGFVSSVRVRLLHATVRRRIMRLEREKPGYFDMDRLGVPINDMHCIATISVYSTAVLFLALPNQGVRLSESQIADYLALWRWIGYIMGTPVDWMSSPAKAKIMLESIVASEVDPSVNSQIIANNILTAEADMPPLYARREYLAAEAHRLNGRTLALALGIQMPSLYYRALVLIQSYMLLAVSLTYPLLPSAGKERRRQRFLNIGWKMIKSQKAGGRGEETNFDFQYIPNFGQMTDMGPIKAVKASPGSAIAVGVALLGVGLIAIVALLVGTSPAWLEAMPRPVVSPFMTPEQALE